MSTSQSTMRTCISPLFPAPGPHRMHYPSSPSPTTSSTSYWNSMAQQINFGDNIVLFTISHPTKYIPYANPASTTGERGPRNTKSKSSTEKNCAPIKDGDYTFITAAKPADFRSKKTMTAVRKTAMASFLKNEKSKEISSRDSTDESNGVASDGSFSQVATQTAVNTSDTSDSLHPPKCSNRKQQPVSTRQPPHIHLDTPSSPQNQVARLHTPIASLSKPAELITPSRQGIELPFDIKVVPELRSLGKALDPFGTMFQSSNSLVSVEKLKWHCSRYFGTYGLGKHWIPYCLDHPHTFLSTLCLAAAHKDVLEERSSESLETAALRQDVIIMVGENLLNPSQSVADHNIIAVLQLIICEVISRKEADLAFHETGMEAMIEKRGGLYQLGVNGRLASAVSWVHLTSAILRGAEARPMYLEFCNTHQMSNYPASVTIPDSPIFCPRERLFTLERSSKCSPKALELLNDMRAMVDLFLSEESQPAPSKANGLARLHAKITVDYPPVAHFARTRVLREEDWKYEAIRITAVVLSTAMLLRVPLPQSLAAAAPTRNLSTTSTTSMASRSNESLCSTLENQQVTPVTDYSTSPSFSMVNPSPGIDPTCFPFDAHSLAASASASASASSPHSYSSPYAQQQPQSQSQPQQQKRPSIPSPYPSFHLSPSISHPSPQSYPPTPTPHLPALKAALENSNLSDCWADMAGVLFWIGLVMGAASQDAPNKVLARYFSALAVRAGVMLCFEHAEGVHGAVARMGEVVGGLRVDKGTVRKRMRN
ncbi:hypothetical protein IAQ61_006124 [Plenodomus lingam]|uniref:uncharacterized protein n=1 Tax=Leptosphaeria maculans TaxID=5022 RepID=UPI00331FFCE8|nr:hypothetical protein IAQ61_006124 [Plenodomus lingam]